jgi:NhaP-type Na+/H+ or K+/H+ antiporter
LDIALIGIGAAALGIYALVSGRLRRSIISGPLFFTAVGIVVVAVGVGREPAGDIAGVSRVALEMTLALVLFTDAMATNITSWREEGKLPSRLLVVGMPLIILAGAIVAVGVFPEFDLVGAAIVATVLAPTDAALGGPVVSNTRVPVRIREALNIESGLNDGIALPFLLFFLAIGEAEGGANLVSLLLSAIGIAVIVGVVIGWAFGRFIVLSSERGWMLPIWRQISVVAAPVLIYVVADELGGSGFIAAFVGGLTFGHLLLESYADIGEFADDLAEVLTMVAFMIFGGMLLLPRFGEFTWAMLLYALLSLTLIRMLPVAISMIGANLRFPTILYMGWFGPRGLASLIFAAVVLEEADVPGIELMVSIVTLTVALSILLHGITANPGSNAYADWYERQEEDHDQMNESQDVDSIQQRRRITRA